MTEPAGLEGFIYALAEPAIRAEISPAPTAPPDMEPILEAAAEHGIEIIGPPGISACPREDGPRWPACNAA